MICSGVCSLMLIKLGVNSGFSARSCMLASPAVFRRQEFLIRCLGVKSMAGSTSEADAENILRAITPSLDHSKHKGQAGKLRKFLLLLEFSASRICWFLVTWTPNF